MSGLSKTTRCHLIVGPSNSGKTTLLLPFDDLFGHARLFHKPALSSTFPLVNLAKNKRFLFFDDFRHVNYAQGTIDVGTFLSLFNGHPFEIRQSQAFKHGNEDFAWKGVLPHCKGAGTLGAVGRCVFGRCPPHEK